MTGKLVCAAPWIAAACLLAACGGATGAADSQPNAGDASDAADPGPEGLATFANLEGADLDLGYVAEGQTGTADLVLTNTGSAPLVIPVVRYTGSGGFTFTWPCKAVKPGSNPQGYPDAFGVGASVGVIDDKVCAVPLTLAPNSAIQVLFQYDATCSDPTAKCPPPATAYLTLVSNDPRYDASKGEGLELKVSANVGGKCVQAQPNPLDFKSIIAPGFAEKALNLFGCGDKDVLITGLAIVPGVPDPSDFTFKVAGGQALPLTLHPGSVLPLTVSFLPQNTHKNAAGVFQPDYATLVVANDSPVPQLNIPLNGLPVDGQCAVADFQASVEGALLNDNDVIGVQSVIKFLNTSYNPTPGGGIVGWAWSVMAPPGGADLFTPSPTTQNVFFTVNVVGDYVFALTVTTQSGCTGTKSLHVGVPAPQGCHVQLTWTTPLDPDPYDQCPANDNCGSDLDLHVLSPNAQTPGVDLDHDGQDDGFFDVGQQGGTTGGDCFWFNPHPCWVPAKCTDPDYQPSLDRDDSDGACPENWTYVVPSADACYRIGVHYWDDHGFGASYPTIRVWVDQNKLYENATAPKMNHLDLWEVGEVCCTQGTFHVKTTDGNAPTQANWPVIIPNYVNPDFHFTP